MSLNAQQIRTCFLLLLAGTEEAEDGTANLFSSTKIGRSDPPDFQRYMPKHLFKAFLSALPFVWIDESLWASLKDDARKPEWKYYQPVIDTFNRIRVKVGNDGELWKTWVICLDESMSAWRPKVSGIELLDIVWLKPIPPGYLWSSEAVPKGQNHNHTT